MINSISIDYANKILQVYALKCKPLCQSLNISQTSFDILMFLHNHPLYSTARDIVNIRGIKASLVSMHVDKLVSDGYLIRESIIGDRRKTKLSITNKAKPIIIKGSQMQKDFFNSLLDNISEKNKSIFYETIQEIKENLNKMMKEGK